MQVFLYCDSIHYNGQRESVLKKKNITKILEPQSGKFEWTSNNSYLFCIGTSVA